MWTNGVTGAEHPENGNGASRPKGRVGRPPTVAQHSSLVVSWLREDPTLSGAEVVRRIRLGGYTGGKSAIYELVRRLRPTVVEDQSTVVEDQWSPR
jgi:hypothetical protein